MVLKTSKILRREMLIETVGNRVGDFTELEVSGPKAS